MRIKVFLILLGSLTCAVTGCGMNSESLYVNLTDTVDESELLEDIMIAEDTDLTVKDFAVNLFKESYEEGKNTLISPVSVLYALGMTANGADGETLTQMEDVFGTNIDSVNGYLSQYRRNLPESKDYKLSMANSIWIKDDATLEINKEFLETNRTWYDADVYQAPFDKNTLDNINTWVKRHTDGRIEQILDQIPEDARLYLINALAFDAKWKEEYKPYQVRNDQFTKKDGQKVTKEFMYSEEHRYLEDDNSIGFIKYYKGNKYAFAALLPKEGVIMADYVQSLSGEKLRTLLKNAQNLPVDTSLPKFESEYDVEMSEILCRMGMPDAFDPKKADLSNMATAQYNLYISRVLHKANLQVSETGTKAGAATVVEVAEESAAEEPEYQERKKVYLNRPFVYALIDCEEEVPIFMGSLTE